MESPSVRLELATKHSTNGMNQELQLRYEGKEERCGTSGKTATTSEVVHGQEGDI